MSGELTTLLSGRYIELKMLPLSFGEYCMGEQGNRSISEKYRRYLVNSSFPYTVQLGDRKKVIIDYLQGLYNTVILNDVIARYKITDVMMLKDVAKFLFDNIGNQTSITKVANTMTSYGRKIDPKTVEKYVTALKRELASMQKIKDHYPKFILTLDDDPEAEYDGIRRINALSFLLEK